MITTLLNRCRDEYGQSAVTILLIILIVIILIVLLTGNGRF